MFISLSFLEVLHNSQISFTKMPYNLDNERLRDVTVELKNWETGRKNVISSFVLHYTANGGFVWFKATPCMGYFLCVPIKGTVFILL